MTKNTSAAASAADETSTNDTTTSAKVIDLAAYHGNAPMNDAYVYGEDSAAWQAVLARPMTFLLPKNRHGDIKQTTWNNQTAPLQHWLEGGPEGSLTRHFERREKGYMPLVFGASAGNRRTAQAMATAECLSLDVESGDSMEEAEERLEKLGIAALFYTSFNDGTTTTLLSRDAVLKALKIESDPTDEQVRQYLTDRGQHRPSHIASARIKDQHLHTEEGVKIALEHAPLEKWRVVVPLAEAQKITDLGPFQKVQQAAFASKVRGLAQMLGVIHDESCEDVSRAFYAPSHRPKADYYVAVYRGRALTFDEVPTVDSKLKADGEGSTLKGWAAETARSFEVAELLKAEAPDKVREDKGGLLVVECPFDHLHGNAGDADDGGCHVRDGDGDDGFQWACKHNSCSGHDRLDMLAQALSDGWFERDLIEQGSAYILPAADEEDPAESVEEELTKSATFEERAQRFSNDTTESEIKGLIGEAIAAGADTTTRARITDAIIKVTLLGKRDLNALWKDAEKARRDEEKEKVKAAAKTGTGTNIAVVNEWDFHDMVEYSDRRLKDANLAKPHVFHYMERLCVVRENSAGHASLKFVDAYGFAYLLNTAARYVRVSGDGGQTTGVSAPDDVVKHLFAADYGTYPELKGLVSTPTFTRSGDLLTTPGYDYASRLYYNPDATLNVGKVSDVPTKAEVDAAKRLIVEEILADFPLGALSRPEIVSQALEGEGVAAVTNMMALILLPFMRELVEGPTPGHLLTKPAPGTGASLLTDTFSIIATGRPTPALAMPTNKDEMSKTLTSVLSNGQNVVFFDNINHSVDSGELASAMTAPVYQARILGRSQTVEVDVRCAWVFTGNNVTLTSELARRLLFIGLDARLANPELRTGFRHNDIRGWALENRSELVHACLTIIQNWVAKGMVQKSDNVLASYENWSRVMGGVLGAAGLYKFLEGQDDERAKAADAAQDGVQELIEMMADYPDGTLFRPGGAAKFVGERTVNIMDILNGDERARIEVGDEKPDPIQIHGWGYNNHDGSYNTAGKIKGQFEKLARKPHATEAGTLTFATMEDRKNKGVVYRMSKTA
ncbi:hypothetical protein ACFSUD_17210 [Sulfitobacter aestuarii]|uniref:Uncharacterized protein n=1 Tax=Sulfitobacter aestuarii TaxID=2161676 RepID=A0ABW5U675_9RHOB